MKNVVFKSALGLTLLVCLASAGLTLESSPASEKGDVLLSTMRGELQRARDAFAKLDPAPYFLSYSVRDTSMAVALGSEGSLLNSTFGRRRSADVIIRIGTPALDNAHDDNRASALTTGIIPLQDDRNAIARVLWLLSSEEYRKASRAYANVKTKTQVHAQEEDTSPDFSQESAQTHSDYGNSVASPDQQALEKLVRQYSSYFRPYPYVYNSMVTATVERILNHYVSSEGTQVITPTTMVRVTMQGETRADDGMELMRVETFQTENIEQLPPGAAIAVRIGKMAADLKALRAAPLAEPSDGPALLSGRASAVFFHEVLGHRLEGHRQRGEKEGQTFTKKVNQPVLPGFLSISDDPTRRALEGTPLSGWYEFDDEGMPATRVDVIQNGILKNFLMSRMPIKDFTRSNGHGRSQPGLMPTGRQSNLIVSSSNAVRDSDLRQKLKDEIKKQGKPYGLYFEDIQGGFTLTQRAMPQAFQVLPVLVWRVYPDSRPDELVRGVDIVGTPLSAMERILLTGERTEVFNGICGAESGSVPVSAAAPAMLFSDLEVQKRSHSLNRPPILPPPGFETLEPSQHANSGGQR
jgi:predicted Zn-dependent protease